MKNFDDRVAFAFLLRELKCLPRPYALNILTTSLWWRRSVKVESNSNFGDSSIKKGGESEKFLYIPGGLL